jgi:hypothetical protein
MLQDARCMVLRAMALAGFGNPGVLTLFLAALKSNSTTSRVSHRVHVFLLFLTHHNNYDALL